MRQQSGLDDTDQDEESKAELDALIDSLQRFSQLEASSSPSSSSPSPTEFPIEEQVESAQSLADELLALQSIYQDISLFNRSSSVSHRRSCSSQPSTTPPEPWNPNSRIRLCLKVGLDSFNTESTDDSSKIKLAITVPAHYPLSNSPPQFQLLSKYIGPRQVDSDLFGQILRLFLHGDSNQDEVHWSKGQVVLFEGIEKAREKIEDWLKEKKVSALDYKIYDNASNQTQRKGSHGRSGDPNPSVNGKTTDFDQEDQETDLAAKLKGASITEASKNAKKLEEDSRRIERLLVTAPIISERKSTFIGHAARLESLQDVSLIISHLQSDRKLSKASHPTIHAWVLKSNGVVHRDHDDDGESAAGGRLSHLLDVLNLEDVLVVVTRFFGGVHLGPDRFKFINQAARSALEVLGAVEGPLNPSSINGSGEQKNVKKSK